MKVNNVFSMKVKPHILIVIPKQNLLKTYDCYSHKYSVIYIYKTSIPQFTHIKV